MVRPSILDEIRVLDPQVDHERIVFLCTCYEFPFDMTRALEFALFRTFCVPSISALLDRTGQFQRGPQKRYDDTDLLVSELMEWGYGSERGTRALRRINQLHGQFTIANEDYLYVLSTFIFEPIRWNTRFGWRRMCEQERLAMFYFWREVGRRMNIQDIPAGYDELERYNVAYERTHFRYTEANHRVGVATRDLFLSWFPRLLHPLVRPAIYSVMDDPLLAAFGFPRPAPLTRRFVTGMLKARARLLRWLPRRRRPRLRTEMKHPSYPTGYRIEDLGPTKQPEKRTEGTKGTTRAS
jgi:hypothetical protein